MNLSEALRLVAQTIATLLKGVGVAIVAVAVVLATVRYLAGLAARHQTLPSDVVRLGLGRSLALSLNSCWAPTSCARPSSRAGTRSAA